MDESLGVLESPRVRGRVPSERRHFVSGTRKWVHGPERSRRHALERKFDMEAISVPKDQLPSKHTSELDDSGHHHLWRKFSPAAGGFVLTQGCFRGVALRDVPYAHLLALRRACEARAAADIPGVEGGICAATGQGTRQGTRQGTPQDTRRGTRQGTRKGVLAKRNRPSPSTVADLRHSSLHRLVQEILKEWDGAEKERGFTRNGASTVPWRRLAQAISHWEGEFLRNDT
jgi:hypothetical protein